MARRIEAQLVDTIEVMQKAIGEGSHVELRRHLEKYKFVLNNLNNKTDQEKMQMLKKISGLARGCLEFTSDYSQEYLKKMSETESLIKQFSEACI